MNENDILQAIAEAMQTGTAEESDYIKTFNEWREYLSRNGMPMGRQRFRGFMRQMVNNGQIRVYKMRRSNIVGDFQMVPVYELVIPSESSS